MSGLGVGHVRQTPLESGLETGYVRIFLASWIAIYVFDGLHFTNSLDASPLIVRSS
jgi:hypothetical protein